MGYMLLGAITIYLIKIIIGGFYIVNQNERAVKTSFGRAIRVYSDDSFQDADLDDAAGSEERERYQFPELVIIPPGGPYFKFPWQKVYKVSVATNTIDIAYDPDCDKNNDNRQSQSLEAIAKDQMNLKVSGQIRFRVSENNIYAYVFGIRHPICHIMGYFVSILREKISNFEDTTGGSAIEGAEFIGAHSGLKISINDLRKNLRRLNDIMEQECQTSEARYGIILEASLITGIESTPEVESALAAINTAHNQVSSNISLANAYADQTIVQAQKVVEIETLRAQSEVAILNNLATQLKKIKETGGREALEMYLRNIRLATVPQTRVIYRTGKEGVK